MASLHSTLTYLFIKARELEECIKSWDNGLYRLTLFSKILLTCFLGWEWGVAGDPWWAGSSWSCQWRWRWPWGLPVCSPAPQGTPLRDTRTERHQGDPATFPAEKKKKQTCYFILHKEVITKKNLGGKIVDLGHPKVYWSLTPLYGRAWIKDT